MPHHVGVWTWAGASSRQTQATTITMHLCLELGHIQREIFEHVYEPPAWSWVEACFADRRSLASLAVTCRAFYENAMDLLWGELDSFAPIVMCMPPYVWQKQPARGWSSDPPDILVSSPPSHLDQDS